MLVLNSGEMLYKKITGSEKQREKEIREISVRAARNLQPLASGLKIDSVVQAALSLPKKENEMKLREILWKNWRLLAKGGLDAVTIERELCPTDRSFLLGWVHQSCPDLDHSIWSLASIVELATWSVHGTDELPFLPADVRAREVERWAFRTGVSAEILHQILASGRTLDNLVEV